MIRNGHRATSAGALADRDILVEGRGALNGRLIDLLVLPDLVRGAVAREGALLRARFRIPDRIFHDVVLHERVGGPTIDG